MLRGPLFQKLHWPREGVEYCDEYVDCMSRGSQCLFTLLTLTLGGNSLPFLSIPSLLPSLLLYPLEVDPFPALSSLYK